MMAKRPALKDRPVVAEYDCSPDTPDAQRLTHRPMNDEEYDDLLARQKAHIDAVEAPQVHPLVAQIAAMSDEDKAALAAALTA